MMKNKLFCTFLLLAILAAYPANAAVSCKATATTPARKVMGLHLHYPADKRSWDWASDLGVKWARVPFEWRRIEKDEGRYDWTEADMIVTHARTRKIALTGLLNQMPEWAVDRPDRAQKFAEFAQAVTSRYKDIVYWEIFNEPNRPGYGWPNLDVLPEQNAAAYADALRFANPAIRSVHPAAVIIAGGLSPKGDDPAAFLRTLYAKDVKRCFDIAGYHPYGAEGAFDLVFSRLFDVMSEADDAAKPVWFTEYGTDSDADRARVIDDGFAQMPVTQALFWFAERDLGKWSERFGLVDIDGNPKPEYALFKERLVKSLK